MYSGPILIEQHYQNKFAEYLLHERFSEIADFPKSGAATAPNLRGLLRRYYGGADLQPSGVQHTCLFFPCTEKIVLFLYIFWTQIRDVTIPYLKMCSNIPDAKMVKKRYFNIRAYEKKGYNLDFKENDALTF